MHPVVFNYKERNKQMTIDTQLFININTATSFDLARSSSD